MADQEAEEPSIEEILTSIRQIISDDDEEEGAAAAEEAPVEDVPEDVPESPAEAAVLEQPDAEDARESDLDLSQAAEEMPEPIEAPAEEPVESIEEPAEEVIDLVEPFEDEVDIDLDEASDDDSMDIAMQDADTDAPMPEAEPEPVAAPLPDLPPSNEASDLESELLTNPAKTAAMSGFSELAKKTTLPNGAITLEDIVRSELQPLLRDWLDAHLPPMIERLVKEELQRITKHTLGE